MPYRKRLKVVTETQHESWEKQARDHWHSETTSSAHPVCRPVYAPFALEPGLHKPNEGYFSDRSMPRSSRGLMCHVSYHSISLLHVYSLPNVAGFSHQASYCFLGTSP